MFIKKVLTCYLSEFLNFAKTQCLSISFYQSVADQNNCVRFL